MRIIGSITLLVVIVWLSFSSCEKTIDLDYPQYEKMVIVNGYLSPGDPVKIWLNYSNSYTEEESTQFEPIKDAEVKLYEDGEFLCRLPYADSVDNIGDKAMYLNRNHQPSTCKTYKLEVKVPGKELVTAQTRIPERQALDVHPASKSTYFSMSIWDDPNQNNYYLFHSNKGYTYRWDTVKRNVNVYIETYDPVVDNGEGLISQDFLIFTDDLMTNEAYNLSFRLNTMEFDTVYAMYDFYSITRDAYLYHKTALEQVDDEEFPFQDDFYIPISEPKPVYTNINNGMGIFAGVNGVRDTVMVIH